MSIQFGRLNFDGRPVKLEDFERVGLAIVAYGPDGERFHHRENLGILFRAFFTTSEARYEAQPYVSTSGAIVTWDGRLDNREELINYVGHEVSGTATDLAIVAAVYDRCQTKLFAKLIGDWALSIWNPADQSLLLAKDPLGARPLYYSVTRGEQQITWSSVLDPLVLFAGHSFPLDEEYVAGWLSSFPAAHLTPYIGIRSVPPSCFVRFTRRGQTFTKYWDFDPHQRIRHRTDADYEEHFRVVFSESVRRRLRADGPVLAELSGGMDSSSIICVADQLISQGRQEARRLDTVSYYDSGEPNWNELPYLAEVEQARGRAGCHIPVNSLGALNVAPEEGRPILTPNSFSNEPQRRFLEHLRSSGYRVVLSGIGGDEVAGGVPTAIPELSDLLVSGRVCELARQLQYWALDRRRPCLHLLAEALRSFVPRGLLRPPLNRRPPVWLQRRFSERNKFALSGYDVRLRLFGPLPSFQENLKTLQILRGQLAAWIPSSNPVYEERYPYLDRTLLEFLFAVPRAQLLRPGARKSLLRRALRNVVPALILDRKRKAFVARGPTVALASFASNSNRLGSAGESLGIIDSRRLSEVLQLARRGIEIPVVTIVRTLLLDSWIRHGLDCGFLDPAQVDGTRQPIADIVAARVLKVLKLS